MKYSIFKKALAMALCVIMIAGVLTACLPSVEFNPPEVGTNAGNKPVATEPTTGKTEGKDPVEDDPNQLFAGETTIDNSALIYGALVNDVVIGGEEGVAALVPADVKVEMGASALALSIKNAEEAADVEGEALSNLDVHISGIAADNTTPMTVMLGAILPSGLANTELKLYHIENGTPVLMTRVNSVDEFAIHNQYVYNAETGSVTIYVASFSVFTAVKTEASKWEGTSDYSWYNSEATEFTLTTAAQFAGFRDLVDGGNTFEGKTVKLGVDIDLDNKLFNPIGGGWAYNGGNTFNGTFDGANHTIYNIYVNGWELDAAGDTHTCTSKGAGLFSSIHNATIKNLAIEGAEMIVETTSIGVVAGCAQGKCTFENIVVTNAGLGNYQMRNGGIVGDIYVIESDGVADGEYSHTFKNITVDSSVTLSSMWGDFDTGNGGVIGGKYGSAKVLMQNVTVAAELDVFSDVTAAYQWYAYRRCGMLIGYTGQNSPKQATNASADFLTCENVNVYYGDWTNYTYYQFTNQDSSWQSNYPWVRAQESDYNGPFSNVRYGNPVVNGVAINTLELAEKYKTGYAAITFNQLYGGGQGVYGAADHAGVNRSYSLPKTYYIENNLGWTNLKLHYEYRNGEDTWTTIVDGIDLVEVNGVYRIDLPINAYSFTITADGGYESKEFVVSELSEKETYPVHEHNFEGDTCNGCGATKVDTWEKLINESELKVGDIIVFVYEKGKMELSSFSTTSKVYGIGAEYDTLPNGIMVFEVVAGSTDGTIAFKNGDRYLHWKEENTVSMDATLNANTSWTVSVDENGNATVLNAKDNTRKLQWNATNPRFACYTSSQAAISIYVKVADVQCKECVMTTIDHKDASCGVEGYTTTQCTACGKVETTKINAIEHDYTGSNPYICLNNCGIHNLPEAGSTITIQEALWIAETLENGKETSNKYIITGVINDKDHPSSTGATTITIDEKSIYITNIHNADGSIGHEEFITKLQNGDEIIVSAKIAKNDSGEAQLRETWLAAHLDTNEDGTCDYCGIVFNAAEMTESLKVVGTNGTLASDKSEITWTQNGVTVSNDKAGSTTAIRNSDSDHYRIYKSSKITISVNDATITKVVITCTSSYINGIKNGAANAGYTVSVDGLIVTITSNESVTSIEFTVSEQARMTNVEVTYTTGSGNEGGSEGGETPNPETPCEHTNTTRTTVDATCTTAGSITVTCDDCKEVVSTETIPVTEHNYVDGTCSVCDAEDPNYEGGSSEPTEPTVVLEITKDDFNSTSYAANNKTKTENGYSYTSYQVMNQSSTMQWQKSKGYITIASNDFVKLELKVTAGTYTVTVGGKTVTGTTANGVTTYDLTGLTGEVKISVASATGKVDYLKFYK